MDIVVSRYYVGLGDKHQLVLITRGALDAIAGTKGEPISLLLDEHSDAISRYARLLATEREPNELGYTLTAEWLKQQS
jgi:hypothetical protein